jgi:hypothetical protein
VPDSVVQAQAPQPPSAATTATSFDGISAGAYAPPDTDGDVGLSDYVQLVNVQYAVYNKNGTLRFGPVDTSTLWQGFGGACQFDNDGDGIVLYDGIANRWVISQFAIESSSSYTECVAVSTSSDPTGSFYRYSFPSLTGNLPDYPKLGVWPDAYYATFNLFTPPPYSYVGGQVCAYDRTQMLQGSVATQQCFSGASINGGMLPADLDGPTPPPAQSPEYLLALASSSSMDFWSFHVDFATPANTTLTNPSVVTFASAPFSEACGGGTCIPQSDTGNQLDSLADRLMSRLAYRNFGSYASLVVNHSVQTGNSLSAVRWYEIRISSGVAPTAPYQLGTFSPDGTARWMGSVAMNKLGDIVLGYSASSGSTHPSIRYTGRRSSDAAGTMTFGESTIFTGNGSQDTISRWGDYSAMTVDPSDDCTFWYTSEYIPFDGSFNWRTRITKIRPNDCTSDFSISMGAPSLSLYQGGSAPITVQTATTSGSAQTVTLSATGFPTSASGSFNPTQVQSGQDSTLTVDAGAAPPGSYTITVKGTGTSATHSTSFTLTVLPSDFSINANPTAVAAAEGLWTTTSIHSTVTLGISQPVTLSGTGPGGATLGFNPNPIAAGASATMTVSVAPELAAGTYGLTVVGTSVAAVHSIPVSLMVSDTHLKDGGFESGSLGAWTASGASSAVVSGGHSGTYAAQLGSPGTPTNGDSSISQTFLVPATGGILSFWYQVHCPDVVTNDWATATLLDTSTGTTVTLLPKTCNDYGNWAQVIYNLAPNARHMLTLTLTSHDDNDATFPTYTLFDDVGILSSYSVVNPVQDPGFEASSLSPWIPTGSAKLVAQAHAGLRALMLGSGASATGDSTAAQTFTIPAGARALSLYYRPTCPGSLSTDWTNATLTDQTAGGAFTVLPQVCSTSPTWQRVTVDVSALANHSVTLTLSNHATAATDTLFDDVTVQ